MSPPGLHSGTRRRATAHGNRRETAASGLGLHETIRLLLLKSSDSAHLGASMRSAHRGAAGEIDNYGRRAVVVAACQECYHMRRSVRPASHATPSYVRDG